MKPFVQLAYANKNVFYKAHSSEDTGKKEFICTVSGNVN
jgi:hypothetical protein